MNRSIRGRSTIAVAAAVVATGLLAPPVGAHGSCDDHEYQVRRGEPGYSTGHDRDGDGIGCDMKPARPTTTPPPPPPPPPPAVPMAVGGAATAAGDGVWVGVDDGAVRTVAGAPYLGDAAGARLNAPVVGIDRTADGGGYWLLGRDGGVFTYGNAAFHGSTGDLRLNQPIVSLASDPQGRGYHFVAADGGVFSFGAPFRGSAGDIRLAQPVVGMATTTSGEGYWLVARDGGIFSYGDAPFSGSTGSIQLNQPIVGMAADPDGVGYWFVAADGGVFSYDAAFHGSPVGRGWIGAQDRVVGITAHPAGGYFVITASGGVIGFGAASEVASPPSRLISEAPVSPDDTGHVDIGTPMVAIRGDDGCIWTFEGIEGAPSIVTTDCAAGSTQPPDPFFP